MIGNGCSAKARLVSRLGHRDKCVLREECVGSFDMIERHCDGNVIGHFGLPLFWFWFD